MTVADELRKEGEKEGIRKGIEKGIEKDLKDTVAILLAKKFKLDLPQEMQEKIKNAKKEDLLAIRNNIFEIENLEEVKKIIH
ncbi:hypothetical protein [Natronospora cellulosivora (SeqCode)]